MMQVEGASLGVSGVFYVLFGLWWHLQVTKKFWRAHHSKTSFSSTVTYPCCTSFRKCAVEGILKLLSSMAVCILCVVWLGHSDKVTDQNAAMGQLTVFVLFCVSGVCDILSQSCPKFIFPNLDYLAMVFCFNLQSIVLAYHTESKDSWTAVADTYAMIAATGVALAVLLEFKFPGCVWCALMRAYCTVVLGTWLIHMVLYYSFTISINVADIDVNVNTTAQANKDTRTQGAEISEIWREYRGMADLVWVPIFFSWHCAVVLVILTALWLLTYVCAHRNYCACVPGEEDGMSHFENRVHFDYHVISRMTDSDIE